jgi:hypothetical protein
LSAPIATSDLVLTHWLSVGVAIWLRQSIASDTLCANESAFLVGEEIPDDYARATA